LTAHSEFGEGAKTHIAKWSSDLVTSSLGAWILYVFTRLENIASILDEVGVELVPLTISVLSIAEKLEKPGDYEDKIHLATMVELDMDTIISNDKDFEGITGITQEYFNKVYSHVEISRC
jgi:hypothetical protein